MQSTSQKKRALKAFVFHLKEKYLRQKAQPLGFRFRETTAKRLERRVLSILKKQQKYFLDELKKINAFSEEKGFFVLHKKSVTEDVKNIVDKMPYKEELAALVSSYYLLAMKKAYKDMKSQNSLTVNFDFLSPDVLKILQTKEDFYLSDYRGTVSEVTKRAVYDVIIEGYKNGDSYQTVAQKIMEMGEAGVFSPARAQLIAIQEIGQAYGQGQFMTFQKFVSQTGRKVEKRWSTVGDDRVRDSHKANEADGWKDFSQGFSGTGEQFAPSSDFRCRCTTQYRVPKNT